MKNFTSLRSQFYGDQTRWFVATVVDGSAPYGFEGRIRIRIHGVHSRNVNDVGQTDLPWAQMLIPTTEGGTSGIGRIPRILPGALVFGIFIDGKDSQIPLVLGSLPKNDTPTTVQAGLLGETGVIGQLYSYPLSLYNYGNISPPTDVDDNLSISSKIDRSVSFFIDNGYTAIQACGIVGALQSVSGLSSSGEEGRKGQGIGDWGSRENRLTNLVQFASQFEPAKDWTDFDVQLAFVLYELRTFQTVANARILSTDKIDTGRGSAAITLRFYLKRSSSSLNAAISNAKSAFEQVNN